MKDRPKKPYIAPPRGETLRHSIISILKEAKLSAREISAEVGIPEREVSGHLIHIHKTLDKRFVMTPAICKKCGFRFVKRDKLTKPGKCPICHNEYIQPPTFTIRP